MRQASPISSPTLSFYSAINSRSYSDRSPALGSKANTVLSSQRRRARTRSPMRNGPGELKTIRFGTFELDVDAGELRKQGLKIRLQEQPLRVLQMLLANPSRL